MKIGLFGIGLEAYWGQFQGLQETLRQYLELVRDRVTAMHPYVINAGLVDTTDKAFEAGRLFRTECVDVIFLYVTTYALSATVLPVVQRAGVPVIILNLSPGAAIDYNSFNQLRDRAEMTGEWLRYCAACPVPEIANVFKRCGISFHQVTGTLLEDDPCWLQIREWVEAAKVADILFNNRLGVMGHYYSGMLDIYTDLTAVYATFGGHIEVVEVDELSAIRKTITEEQIDERVALFSREFDVQKDCPVKELERAARTSVALERLVEKYKLGSLAYYYKGINANDNEDTISSIILGNSLLTGRGIPVAGEYEIKNAVAMKIMDSFGAGGSFTEFYALDFKEDIVLMGHDGPGHIAIAEGKTKVRPLGVYHGKTGSGLSVEMTVKYGPVTLLSVIEGKEGSLMLLSAEAESVPGPILEIGNTNSRYRFPTGVRNFVNAWNSFGPAHHCAVGIGHIHTKIEKLGKLLEIETRKIC